MMLHNDITEKIISACFEVANELGSGFLESVYEKALTIVLKQNGHKIKCQHPVKVTSRNECVGEFIADILVDDKVIVELKAVKALSAEHSAQLINYLNATGIDEGLLVNFGTPKIEYHRFVRSEIFQKITKDRKTGISRMNGIIKT